MDSEVLILGGEDAARVAGSGDLPLMLIGVCTLNRHAQLTRLLQSLAVLRLPRAHRLELLIVENQAARTIDPVVAATPLPFPVAVVNVPQAGLANARNALLEIADTRGAAIVIGVDDDEVVVPGWAHAYEVGFRKLPHCTALMGWVDFAFEGAHSDWAPPEDLGREILGQRRRVLSSTNFALRDRVFNTDHGIGLRFDTRYNLTGGEDSDFFMRLIGKHGHATSTVPQARSTEYVPANRATLRASLERAWAQMVVYYRIDKELMHTSVGRSPFKTFRYQWALALRFLFSGLLNLLQLTAGAGALVPRIKRNFGRAMWNFTCFAAYFGSVFGQVPEPYREDMTAGSADA
jgi:succinoglycan biosynthesis protein ExoM